MPANPQASQANDASRADQDSPFALLMAASAPKEEEPTRAQEPVEKPASDQAAAAAQPAKPQTQTTSKPKSKPDERTKPDEKSAAKNDGQDKKEEVAASNDNAAPVTEAVTEARPVATNSVPQPIVPLVVVADTAAAAPSPEITVQETPAIAATTPAATPTQDLAALTAAAANDATAQAGPAAATPAATQTQAAPQPQTQQAAAPPAGAPQNLASETPQGITDPQPAAPQVATVQTIAAAQPDAAQDAAQASATAAPTKEALVQIATLQNPSSAKPAQPGEETGEQTDAPASTGTAIKTDTVKPVAHDIAAENKDVKPDAPRPEIAKPDTVKPDTAQTATIEAPKPAPQAQAQPNTNMASFQPNTATQTPAGPAALPGIPQHVQVSTQAAQPNMPALAVEIAAKSQSGAKQFDIRLDPPELGRVEVRLSIDAAGKASAHLSADQPQTLDLLQKDASSLTRALREAGLNVSQDGLNFSLRQQNHDGAGAQQGQARNTPRGTTLTATNSIEATQNSANWRGDGRLDIRV